MRYFLRLVVAVFVLLPLLPVLALAAGVVSGIVWGLMGVVDISIEGWGLIRQFVERGHDRQDGICMRPPGSDKVIRFVRHSGEAAPWI